MEWHSECFTEAEISAVRKASYDRGLKELREDLHRCNARDDQERYLARIEAWHSFPGDPSHIADQKLSRYFQPNVLDREDDYRELRALNGSCQSDPKSFDKAMSFASSIQDEEQRMMTELEVIRRFYVAEYRRRLVETEEYTVDRFHQRYPLETYWGTFTFAERMALESEPMPRQFIMDFALDESKVNERIQAQFLRHRGTAAVDLAEAYVQDGHDSTLIWMMALESLLNGGEHNLAIQVAYKHLGAKQVTRVEDARIAHLESEGRYSVMEVGGRRVRVYPMYNEQTWN